MFLQLYINDITFWRKIYRFTFLAKSLQNRNFDDIFFWNIFERKFYGLTFSIFSQKFWNHIFNVKISVRIHFLVGYSRNQSFDKMLSELHFWCKTFGVIYWFRLWRKICGTCFFTISFCNYMFYLLMKNLRNQILGKKIWIHILMLSY